MKTNEEVLWIDIDFNQLTRSDITDTHLINIINFIARGGGHSSFLNLNRIDALYNEALRRGIKLKRSRSNVKRGYLEKKGEIRSLQLSFFLDFD